MEFIKVLRPTELGDLEELEVVIDGEIIGLADATLAVAEGVHHIELKGLNNATLLAKTVEIKDTSPAKPFIIELGGIGPLKP